MIKFEIKKENVSDTISTYSIIVDDNEELFVTPLHTNAEDELTERIMRFIFNSCHYMLDAAKINGQDPFDLAHKLSSDVKSLETK